ASRGSGTFEAKSPPHGRAPTATRGTNKTTERPCWRDPSVVTSPALFQAGVSGASISSGHFLHRAFGSTKSEDRFLLRERSERLTGGDLYLLVPRIARRSEEHTSELQSRGHLVCRLLLEK